MDIEGIRDAIAQAASAVVLPAGKGALTCLGYTPDQVTAPMFFVAEFEINYDLTFGGRDALELTCRLLVSRGDERSAQGLLSLLLQRGGPASLKTAIEAARGAPGQPALDGLADDLQVKRVQGNRLYEHAGVQYIGAEVIIRVIGDGS